MAPIPTASRPKMQNYGVTADSAGLLAWDWANNQLNKSRNYWIASTRPDGTPHVAPVWGVWIEGALYFGSDLQSRKARNFAQQPRAALHLESGDEVVILDGHITIVTDAELLKRIGVDYATKYGFDPNADPLPGSAFFAFAPLTGLSWVENDFPKTATRWAFTATAPEDSSS